VERFNQGVVVNDEQIVKLGLAGDTMLGRGVASRLEAEPASALFADEVVEIAHEADLFVLNLECAISERGERWPDPRKPFFFRAPPAATDVLTLLGVDCVTLANNHALDYGPVALIDTLEYLRAAGVAYVGAGRDERAARSSTVLEHDGFTLGVVGLTDHPAAFNAGPDRPGVAYADLANGRFDWVTDAISDLATEAVLVTPHWGPNMVPKPVPHVRAAAAALQDAGATLIAGHSAHVFHGAEGTVIYDLGDFIDDYAVNRGMRNDLTLLFLVTFVGSRPHRVEAIPLTIDYCHTRLAGRREARWIADRFRRASAELNTTVVEEDGRLVVDLSER
jgi:poly-gamma-glutamate synthesis protein (capsule biosynthesis protein)